MIVERCGGRIGVQSEPGRGTEFTVVLPDDGELLGKNSGRDELMLRPDTNIRLNEGKDLLNSNGDQY